MLDIILKIFVRLQGDWMWQFAAGLYLVHLANNELRLAAISGFTGGGLILVFGGVIGNWIDNNERLKGMRIFCHMCYSVVPLF